jgi:hypothetical protein
MSENPDMGHQAIPPVHRDKTAMNGPQLFNGQDDSSGLMSGPPAIVDSGQAPFVMRSPHIPCLKIETWGTQSF